MILVMILALVFMLVAGILHGQRMYRLGEQHGRKLEALDARHARERILASIDRDTAIASMHAISDCQMIERWVRQAFMVGKGPPS